MRTISEKELKTILEKHIVWLEDRSKGERANLSGANLSRANLSRANLIYFHFFQWNGYAQKERLVIGCHAHPWEDWKKHGKGYAKDNNCLAEFKEFWPALETFRKILAKRKLEVKP